MDGGQREISSGQCYVKRHKSEFRKVSHLSLFRKLGLNGNYWRCNDIV